MICGLKYSQIHPDPDLFRSTPQKNEDAKLKIRISFQEYLLFEYMFGFYINFQGCFLRKGLGFGSVSLDMKDFIFEHPTLMMHNQQVGH